MRRNWHILVKEYNYKNTKKFILFTFLVQMSSIVSSSVTLKK